MELKEMIKVMQHYEDGGDVEYSEDCFKTIKGESNNKNRFGLSWDWDKFDYRIKEQKQKVTIEKWLCEYVGCEELKGSKRFFIIEKVVPFELAGKKLKLIETYEVEL